MSIYIKQFKLLILLLVLISCSDMGEPLILEPEIQLVPESLDFGVVTLGETQSRDLLIMNLGQADLHLDLLIDPVSLPFSADVSGTQVIEPGDTLQVTIDFLPQSSINFSADLLVVSNDPNRAQLQVPLMGAGTTLPVPGLTVSQSTLDFGSLLVGEAAQASLQITSTGTAELTIDSMVVNMTGVSLDATTPVSLQPTEHISVNLNFDADVAGNRDGSFLIYSNVSSSPTLVQLSAQVVALVSYANSLQPVWNNSCSGCHGSNGGLSLASYADLMSGNSNNGPVVVAGNGANSLIVRKLRGTAGTRMPAGGPALSDEMIGTIETWIDQGALDN